ncbi:MAG: hypothetical protein HFF18_04640 [Oscillospiraceae bacterium]|nr:hypothetical protein [Oscillospiraceae bacterium]
MTEIPMPDLNPDETALLLQALDAMTENLQKLRRSIRDPIAQTSSDTILDCIISSRSKLRKRKTEFTQNEVAAVYLSLSELRGGLSDMLDDLPAASDLRPKAQQAFRRANHLSRRMRQFFEAQDVDTAALLSLLRDAL